MPIWLRRFTFNKLKSWYDSQNPSKNDESWTSGPQKNIAQEERKKITPPTYVTKASKK